MRTQDEQKRLALQEAVVELTNREGFDGLSMHKLAKSTNLSASTIYVYYQNREDMLNQVYKAVGQHQAQALLLDFDPLMAFEEGVWVQWRNRYHYILHYPHYYQFMEQFRHSPLIQQAPMTKSEFIDQMSLFFRRAVEQRLVPDYEPPVLWSLIFGPLYALAKFGTTEMGLGQQPFILTEDLLKKTAKGVVNALQHEAKGQ